MIINYQKEFVKRTVDLLERGYEPIKAFGREATFLMNCLLGTIVIIAEQGKNETKRPSNKFLRGVINMEFLSILGIPDKTKYLNKKKVWLIKNIRHGIAHQHIRAFNAAGADNESHWEGVIIRNPQQNFIIEFRLEELRQFVINLAKNYYAANNH
ncbi:MAG: hypothetical protein LBG31_05900 [Prevotellaceae bacterium]|jgi:hypothetical protein|nr:hypothetical protein [Prevotellaceae bacterium]